MSSRAHASEPDALQRPRTALVHDWLTGMRGGEKVLEQFGALFPDSPIHTLFHFPGSVSAEIESHPIVTSYLQKAPALRSRYRHYLPLFPSAIEDLDLGGYDLVISTSHCVAKGVLPAPGSRHLCYCFTPMRYAWDQERAYFPRRTGLVARMRGLALARLRNWDAASAGRVDQFVAISRFVADRIYRYYRRRSVIIHPPADTEFFTPGPGAEGDYCLAVAALVPYKRLEVAIAACERLGMELRIVGDGPGRSEIERLAGPHTRLMGRVEAETLRDLYRGAACYLQPGIEDFGISTVEALACGCPAVGFAHGGILDIVEPGEHGTLFFEEGGAEALAAAIDKTRKMRFNQLNLRERAETFSVSRFRRQLKALLSQPDWSKE